MLIMNEGYPILYVKGKPGLLLDLTYGANMVPLALTE